ncbi:MAG: NlpC/P60 family protein [Clostridium sp.]
MKRSDNCIIRIIIMSISGCVLIFFASRYTPAKSDLAAVEEEYVTELAPSTTLAGINKHFVTRVTDEWNHSLAQLSTELLAFGNKKIEYTPSVLKYNLVNLFPDENSGEVPINENTDSKTISEMVDPSDLVDQLINPFLKKMNLPIRTRAKDSYGGKIYEKLSRKDADWTSTLYQWIQTTPVRAAQIKNLPTSAVTGKYNPINPLHKATDPSTWVIPSWKNVTVNFYDGDGNKIDLYSNAKVIASMASVNTYYTGWQDIARFESYTEKLWNTSHRYNVSLSEVYYCDGCVDLLAPSPNIQNTPVQESLTQEANESASETSEADKAASGAPQEYIIVRDGETKAETLPDESEYAVTSTEAEVLSDDIKKAPAKGPAMEISAAETTTVETETTAAKTETTAAKTETTSIKTETTTAKTETTAAKTEPVASEIVKKPEIHLNSAGKFCPGHVDIKITAWIVGLSEKNNLFVLDRTHDKSGEKIWTPYLKSYVNQLYSQDWKEKYGLSPTALAIGKPLTSNEINDYLNTLPPDTSAERRAVVAFALNSVGKIPYYYGGKPASSGYENNTFATPIRPDTKGRVLSGLDCSGWINWVYWSSIGKHISSLGTSGLIHEGQAIRRRELKPGDIMVKTGVNSHVVMFLGWAPNNSMICIHETGGVTNNVTVSTIDAQWPYYRTLLN